MAFHLCKIDWRSRIVRTILRINCCGQARAEMFAVVANMELLNSYGPSAANMVEIVRYGCYNLGWRRPDGEGHWS